MGRRPVTTQPTLAIVGMGKRDVASDYVMPRPLRGLSGDGQQRRLDGAFVVTGLNDQHAYISSRHMTRYGQATEWYSASPTRAQPSTNGG